MWAPGERARLACGWRRRADLESPFSNRRWVAEDCGATPQTTRRRRVLPIAFGIVTA